MKNRAVKLMMAAQYNVGVEDVSVEFLHAIGSEYTFKVMIELLEDTPSTTHKEIILKVEQAPHMGDDYNKKYSSNC